MWVGQVSNFFRLVGGPPQKQVDYASTLLQGTAQLWWQRKVKVREDVAARGRPLNSKLGGGSPHPDGAPVGLRLSAGIAGGRCGVLFPRQIPQNLFPLYVHIRLLMVQLL